MERTEWDTETNGLWMFTALLSDHTSYLFRGTGTASTQEYELSTLATGARALYLIGAGVGGDTIMYQNFPDEYLLYADASGTLVEPSPNIGDIDVSFYGNRYPGTSRKVGLRADDGSVQGHIYVSSDYRGSVAPTAARTASSSLAPPAIAVGDRLCIATGNGIVEILNPFGTPSDQTVAMSGLVVNWLHCDAQSRELIAGITLNAVHVWDSTTDDIIIIDISGLSDDWLYVHIVKEGGV
jgi:hypothetical protein